MGIRNVHDIGRGRTFAIGDIHGYNYALAGVLRAAAVDPEEDLLIILGDVCDGGPAVRACIDVLRGFRHIMILGNHDYWTLQWMETGAIPTIWTSQGGMATLTSYNFDRETAPAEHRAFLKDAVPYYIDGKRRALVHGGFNPILPLHEQQPRDLMWDRTLVHYAGKRPVPGYSHVFVGHTQTQLIHGASWTAPVVRHNLTMLDTGIVGSGVLTVMDVDTHQYWQSGRSGDRDRNTGECKVKNSHDDSVIFSSVCPHA